MNLNLNIDSRIGAMKLGGLEAETNAVQSQQAGEQNIGGITISHAKVAPEDIAAAEISERDLSRDDALGKLVDSVFSLPPPPMPDFAEIE